VRTTLRLTLAAALLAVAVATTASSSGAAVDEDVRAFGAAPFRGSTANLTLQAPLVGIAATQTGNGYWLLGRDGGVFSYGDAAFRGSTGGMRLNQPLVSMAADPRQRGYWLLAGDGGVFSFGVPFYGSTGSMRLNAPVVGMAATRTGNGYWLLAKDGGVFSFGGARFSGSTGAMRLDRPVVAMAADPDGGGYWLVAEDGGVFSFDAPFHGSAAGRVRATDRVVGMAAHPGGYWLVTASGEVFAFGGAPALGGAAGTNRPVVGMAARPQGDGYWLALARAAPPPPAATAPTPGLVSAVGDSVMLGAKRDLEATPGRTVEVDAVVSRQLRDGDDVVTARRAAGRLGDRLVVHLGNNGPFTDAQFDDLMRAAGGIRVLVVTARVPRTWEAPVNAALAAGVRRWPNAVLVDWHTHSAGQPGWFGSDGFHLTAEGARQYAALVRANLG